MTDGERPAFLAAMQMLSDEDEKEKKAAKQARMQSWAQQEQYRAWLTLWQRFERNLVAYLSGASSQAMVTDLVALNQAIDTLGYGGNLTTLVETPLTDSADDSERQQLAICRLVIGVWQHLRFDGENPGRLVAQLDTNAKRLPMGDVSFVRPVIEGGGLRECPQCGQPMGPSETESLRCRECVAADKRTMRWLEIAIACVDKYGSQSYGDIDSHFPEWRPWRYRLTEHLATKHPGRSFTDAELWEWWIDYARERLGIDNERFLGTPRSEAGQLLPPLPASTQVAGELEQGGPARSQDPNSLVNPDAPAKTQKGVKAAQSGARNQQDPIREIPADRLPEYLYAARLRLKWNQAKKPSGEDLPFWLDEVGFWKGEAKWKRLRNADRQRALKHGYRVKQTGQWVKRLEAEIERRRKAGIPIAEPDSCD